MDILIFVFEIIGTVAFSVSGAMTGLKKNMDIFGVMILGVITAIGGGVIRDLVLGITPPGTFGRPVYAIVATVTAIITFCPPCTALSREISISATSFCSFSTRWGSACLR